jgi:hypothetical protein
MSDEGWNKAKDEEWTEIPNGYSPLNPEWVRFLIGQPETGQGYQIVNVTLIDGNNFRATVLNCKLIDTLIDANMIKNIKVERA